MSSRTSLEQEKSWERFVTEIRNSSVRPFKVHWDAFNNIYAARRAEDGPPPAWFPGRGVRRASNVGWLLTENGFNDYVALHRWSVGRRDRFWGTVINRLGIVFERAPSSILDLTRGAKHPRWLPGASMNCTDSCLTADPTRPAILAGREGSDEIRTTTYGELRQLVERLVAGLRNHGFSQGDAIALYMPMTIECVAIYLAIVRLGGRVVSIADSFASEELTRRLRIAEACAVVTVELCVRGGRVFRLYQKVREIDGPRAVVIPAQGKTVLRKGDLLWGNLLRCGADSAAVCDDPYGTINVLFSSGTTGAPKVIPWNHLTPIKCAMDGHFHQDIGPHDVVAWPTNIGWMMGPWLIFASLVNKAAIALYEGAPTGAGFARFIEKARVTVLGTVPSLVRMWRSSGGTDNADWHRVRVFSSTGEPSNVEDYLWLMSRAGYRAPVIEYCGGTEIGGGYITASLLHPASPGTFTAPALGIDVAILGEDGQPVAEGEMGEAFLVPPSIGLSQKLLDRDHDEAYFGGCPFGPDGEVLRRHGDQMVRLHRGFYRAGGRSDDTMNLSGIKVSSLELEQVLDKHEAVYESAAVSVAPIDGGPERLVVYVVPEGQVDAVGLRVELGRRIANYLNPLFRISDLVVVDRLPRTASNKLKRRLLREQYSTKNQN